MYLEPLVTADVFARPTGGVGSDEGFEDRRRDPALSSKDTSDMTPTEENSEENSEENPEENSEENSVSA